MILVIKFLSASLTLFYSFCGKVSKRRIEKLVAPEAKKVLCPILQEEDVLKLSPAAALF